MVCHIEGDAPTEAACGLRPVLMDFGLARDSLGPQRLTQTGVIMGTPHYMAPEQARGQARHLDRRSDVYSLGAVLYEMLTGKPPFDAESEVELLLSVLHQEPQPPRSVDPSIPLDLEVITLKCLRKEAEQRYDSALALAEDLSRYLHGEPIVARPASTFYRLRRLAARNRAVVAVIAVVLLSLTGFTFMKLRVKEREHAAAVIADQHKQLAAELGQVNTRIGLFLRVAYSLPVHDLVRTENFLRRHLKQLESQCTSTDRTLRGVIESAIGQGYLSLHEWPKAIEHLRLAIEHNNTAPEVHFALGQALGRLYEDQREDRKHQLAGAQLERELDKLKQTVLAEAIHEMKAGKETEQTVEGYSESPIPEVYKDALLAFYDQKYDEALKLTRTAQAQAPWLIEPHDLETKIITASYTERLTREDKTAVSDAPAVRASIERAIGIARSYPDFYRSFLTYATYTVRTAMQMNVDPQVAAEIFDAGVRHAQSAIALKPQSSDAKDQLAELYANWAYTQSILRMDPGPTVEKGLAVVAERLAGGPEDAQPYATRSKLYLAQAMYDSFTDKESLESLEMSARDAKRAMELSPRSSEFANLFYVSQEQVSDIRRWRDMPWEAQFQEALAAVKRAVELSPEMPKYRSNLAQGYLKLASIRSEQGKDGSGEIAAARKLFEENAAAHPGILATEYARANLENIEVKLLHNDKGGSPETITRAQQVLAQNLERMRAYQDHQAAAQFTGSLVTAYVNLASAQCLSGASPVAVVDEAIAALQDGLLRKMPEGFKVGRRADLWLIQAAWLRKQHQSPEPALRPLLAATVQLDGIKGAMQTEILARRAAALRIRAEALLEQKQPAPALAAVTEALRVCQTAYGKNPGGASEVKVQEGALLSLKAQLLRSPAERIQAAGQAVTLLSGAFARQPQLRRDLETHLKAAEAIAGTATTAALTPAPAATPVQAGLR